MAVLSSSESNLLRDIHTLLSREYKEKIVFVSQLQKLVETTNLKNFYEKFKHQYLLLKRHQKWPEPTNCNGDEWCDTRSQEISLECNESDALFQGIEFVQHWGGGTHMHISINLTALKRVDLMDPNIQDMCTKYRLSVPQDDTRRTVSFTVYDDSEIRNMCMILDHVCDIESLGRQLIRGFTPLTPRSSSEHQS
jgi:hypothetical protein